MNDMASENGVREREQRPPPYAGPAVFAAGFRPFFLAAGVWAVVALALSVLTVSGAVDLPVADPIFWHFHEMLFGYVAAAVAGFLLTAVPNWTGSLPVRGRPLIALTALWLAGRAAMLASPLIGEVAAAAVDLAFLAAMFGFALREIVAAGNRRNLPIVVAVFLLLLANAASHGHAVGAIDSLEVAVRLGVGVMAALVMLIGGRVTPSFTRNWLVKQGSDRLPAPFGAVDKAAIVVTVAGLAGWAAGAPPPLTGGLLALAGLLNVVRLSRWQGRRAAAEPLLLVLHVGYLWLAAGLGLAAAAAYGLVAEIAAIHGLAAGAVGTMTLAVMSRATLGHTGRALHAGPALTAAYVLVSLAALTRVAAAVASASHGPLLHVSALAWIAAFALFLFVCGPMLLTRGRAAGG